MPRAGLSPERIVEVAAELADREGPGAIGLSQIAASLGVRTPSLYAHIDGLEALRRAVALHGIRELGDATRTAVMGAGGVDGLRRMAAAYRDYALAHPGVYPLTQEARPEDEEYAALSYRALEPLLAVLAGMGFEREEAIHRARAVRSALHGFVALETGNGFGIDLDTATSFERLVELIVTGLATPARSA